MFFILSTKCLKTSAGFPPDDAYHLHGLVEWGSIPFKLGDFA